MSNAVNGRGAAAYLGVSPMLISLAVKSGKLPARERVPGSRYQGLLIEISDLDKWYATSVRAAAPWTDAEIEALIELSRTCTWEQVGAYLKRPPGACTQKGVQLRRDGIQVGRQGEGGQRNLPWCVSRDAVLLAKTCPKCGAFLDASQFVRKENKSGGRKRHAYYVSDCRGCVNKMGRMDTSDSRRRQRENHDLLNEVTLAAAVNHGQPYTQADDIVLKDVTLSDFEAALRVGHTLNGVHYRRNVLGVRVTGRQHERKCDPNARWTIDFPEAAKAIQQYFRSIGEPVPEELWEWNDEQEMAS